MLSRTKDSYNLSFTSVKTRIGHSPGAYETFVGGKLKKKLLNDYFSGGKFKMVCLYCIFIQSKMAALWHIVFEPINFQKGCLEAKLAFAYGAQKYSVQKVVSWVVSVF